MIENLTWPRKTREIYTRYFDSTSWNELTFRNDDIVIATYPKSGTTWMQQVIGQLVFGGDPALEVRLLSSFFDWRGASTAEKLAEVEAQTYRRFFKTHLPVDALVFSPNARYLYVGRDGRDVAWSRYRHESNYTQAVRDSLNTAPGVGGPSVEAPPADVRQFWRDWLDHGDTDGLNYWEHVRGWWAIRDLPNVLLVHYANLKRDLPGEMRRVAVFLDISIDESRWHAMLEYCSFDWMKAHASGAAPSGDAIWEGGATVFFHQGVNGRWSETLTPEEIAEYEARAVKELGLECAHWLATGEEIGAAS